MTQENQTDLDLYHSVARDTSARVIRRYSTSFGSASRLLGRRVRDEVREIYALVRIADEIVDGAAAAAGLDRDEQRRVLDALEQETGDAIRRGYSANLVVHAFACTARRVGIDASLTAPFFASMRRDLDDAPFDQAGVHEYIYGSAEVVGLMCLRSFLHRQHRSRVELRQLENGACHLGAAFQKVNFLRDLRTDWRELGRNYFPAIDPESLSDEQKLEILDDIDSDIRIAVATLPLLPDDVRAAVTAALALFAALSKRLRETPAAQLLSRRVRVPDTQKLALVVKARAYARRVGPDRSPRGVARTGRVWSRPALRGRVRRRRS